MWVSFLKQKMAIYWKNKKFALSFSFDLKLWLENSLLKDDVVLYENGCPIFFLPCLWTSQFNSKGAKNKFGLVGTQGMTCSIQLYQMGFFGIPNPWIFFRINLKELKNHIIEFQNYFRFKIKSLQIPRKTGSTLNFWIILE